MARSVVSPIYGGVCWAAEKGRSQPPSREGCGTLAKNVIALFVRQIQALFNFLLTVMTVAAATVSTIVSHYCSRMYAPHVIYYIHTTSLCPCDLYMIFQRTVRVFTAILYLLLNFMRLFFIAGFLSPRRIRVAFK